MGSKKKSANPVEAARKAARAREVKKNKENRAQVREQVALKKDTTPLEREIRTIERKSSRSKQDEAELERLRTEVQRIKEIKEDFIRKNPDQRRTVVGYEKTDEEREAERQQQASAVASSSGIGTGLGGIGGRNPKWSVYYDPVFNPYGAPPPGMPYLEKPYEQLLKEGLVEPPPLPPEPPKEDSDDDLDEIAMPEGPPPLPPGPPPGQSTDDGDDDDADDDIVMPAGPPPSSIPTGPKNQGSNVRPPRPPSLPPGRPRPPAGPPPPFQARPPVGPPPPPPGGYTGPPPPLPPPGSFIRPPPPFVGGHHAPPVGGHNGSVPSRGGGRGGMRPRGPPRPVTDPLGGGVPAANPALPPKPQFQQPQPPPPPPQPPAGAVISAAPQLRDLKKEATVFVPTAIRKKRAQEKSRVQMGLPARIDAAPSDGASAGQSESQEARPNLLQALRPHLDGAQPSSSSARPSGDYDNFLNEVGDLL